LTRPSFLPSSSPFREGVPFRTEGFPKRPPFPNLPSPRKVSRLCRPGQRPFVLPTVIHRPCIWILSFFNLFFQNYGLFRRSQASNPSPPRFFLLFFRPFPHKNLLLTISTRVLDALPLHPLLFSYQGDFLLPPPRMSRMDAVSSLVFMSKSLQGRPPFHRILVSRTCSPPICLKLPWAASEDLTPSQGFSPFFANFVPFFPPLADGLFPQPFQCGSGLLREFCSIFFFCRVSLQIFC